MRIVLVRHGETQTNIDGVLAGHLDAQLTERGHEQAKALAARLAEENFDHFYSSDLTRAVHTRQAVEVQHPDLPAEQLPLFRERFLGAWEGVPYSDTNPKQPPADYEGDEALLKRAQEAFDFLHTRHDGGSVLLVGHSFFNKAFLAVAMGVPYPERLLQSNTGLNEIVINEKGELWVTLINCTQHLSAL